MPENQHKISFASKIKKFQMVELSGNIISKQCLVQTVSNVGRKMLLTQMMDILAQLLPLRTLHFHRQRNFLPWLLYQLKQFQSDKLQLTVVQLLKFPTLYSISGGCCLQLPKNRQEQHRTVISGCKGQEHAEHQGRVVGK